MKQTVEMIGTSTKSIAIEINAIENIAIENEIHFNSININILLH